MATKERELEGNKRKGHGLCNCCDVANCGKRKGPYPKKHSKYLGNQSQRVSWRNADNNDWNNDYILVAKENK